ncbi:tyrosine-type recombinase/integrase [Palleronia salina]|nr:site-specific integrase [Palleronia salina]
MDHDFADFAQGGQHRAPVLDGAVGKALGGLARFAAGKAIELVQGHTDLAACAGGYRSRIKPGDADYFRLSRRDEAEARAAPERPAPSVRQAKRALAMMPTATPRDLRDRAVVALLCLTGIRVSALVSLRIKHVDLAEKSVTQNPREVATKFGKRMETFFAKGFDEAEAALAAWLAHLDAAELYGPDDPLFPATATAPSANDGFWVSGFLRRPWRSTEVVRKIVREAFEAAGIPNYGPHAFRHMLARDAAKNAKSVAELIATSQNLGHTDVLTTLRSYGQIDRDRQRTLITGLTDDGVTE